MRENKDALLYRAIKATVKLFYPKMEVEGAQNLPEEPVVIVGNHCQMNGPIVAELYCPGEHDTWCAGQMMHLREVPEYAFRDFWSRKPKYIRWFYRLLSYLIAPLSVYIFNRANTIGVYRDSRIMGTFRKTVNRLQEGASIVIFPEHDADYNHILCAFQDRFVDVARLYYRKTGKELSFVPLYIAPKLRKMYFGKPIRFCACNSIETERERICHCLMTEISDIACALPEHIVVPYRNIPKKDYPSNIPKEESHATPIG